MINSREEAEERLAALVSLVDISWCDPRTKDCANCVLRTKEHDNYSTYCIIANIRGMLRKVTEVSPRDVSLD